MNIRVLLLAIFLFNITTATAQFMPGGGAGKGASAPKMGKIYGKVVNNKNGRPVEFASVTLLQAKGGKDVLVKGANTESNGEFSLEELPMFGQFRLVINSVGYKEYSVAVAFDMAALMKAGATMQGGSGGDGGMTLPANTGALLDAINKDLGNIRLEPVANALGAVVVTAQVPQFQLQGEKKIFNVDQNLTSQGGTAADVMKNVPGVLVDADNKVTIRNAAPQILIDGRQSPLQLDQIPSNAIESVEVITNPSAKYDAEGGQGGVLNIVLKKNRKTGYNGNIRAGIDSRLGANVGGDFNVRQGKFNLSVNAHGNLNRNLTYANTDRTDFYANPDVRTTQDDINQTGGIFGFGRVGLDYFISNRTTLSIGGMKVHGQFEPDDRINITSDSLYSGGDQLAWSRRNTKGKNTFDMNGGSFGIKHLFPRAGEEWTFDANVNAGKNTNDNRYTSTLYSDAEAQHMISQYGQRTAGNGTNTFYTLQSDYSHPFADKSKLDVGVKATIRNLTSNIDNYITDAAGVSILVPNNTSNYKNTDQVYAAYASYSGNINADLSYQLGLRAERYYYQGELTKTGQTFTNDYPVSLYPSVFIAQKLKHDQQLQLSYRRGVNRPNFFQLLPFVDATDPLNIRQGNPALQPEFTNSIEVNYLKNFTRTNYLMVSAYLRHSDHLITQYQQLGRNPFDTSQAAIINSYINANSSDKYGLELTGQYQLTKWWTVLANVNLYNAVINTGDASNAAGNKNYFSGFGKLNNTIKLPWKLNLQVSGVYQGRTSLLPDNKNTDFRGGGGGGGGGPFGMNVASSAQGYLDANWSVDAALRKSWGKGDAASLSLSVNDIFATRHFIQYSESDYFVQRYDRLSNPYQIRLNFNYRFGKLDTDLFRRKNIKGAIEGMQDASQGMGM